MGALQFDFDSSVNIFNLTAWSLFRFESTITESLLLGIEDFPDGEGVVFFLLEVAFFVENEDSYLSFPKNDSKVVYVLGVE